MFRLPALSLAVALAASVVSHAAAAAMLCIPHETMTQNLRESHAEQPVSMGLDNSGVMIEVFAAPAGNWTIVMTQPNGMSCLMAAGQSWETLPVTNAGARS